VTSRHLYLIEYMTLFNNQAEFRKGFSEISGDIHRTQMLSVPSDLSRVVSDISDGTPLFTSKEIYDTYFFRRNSNLVTPPSHFSELIESSYRPFSDALHSKDAEPHGPIGLMGLLPSSLKVLAGIILRQTKPVILLLDRDDTIDGEVISFERRSQQLYGEDGGIRTLRPGLLPLLNMFKNKIPGISVGMITARLPGTIFESSNPLHTARMEEIISPEHRYSVAAWRLHPETKVLTHQYLAQLKDPNSKKFTDDVDIDIEPTELRDGSALGKMVAVRLLERCYPEHSIILYDDLAVLPYFLPGQAVYAPPLGTFLEDRFSLDLLREENLI
jgi:hypothetical protein